MNTPSSTNSIKMLIISLIIFVIIFIYLISNSSISTEMSRFIRILTSLSAAAMSMSLSGSINIGSDDNIETFAQKSPNITAAGSFAVFVIVYLLDPLKF